MIRRDVIVSAILLFQLVQLHTPLRCYSCSFSFNEMYDPEHKDAWCANESLVQFEPDETTKICAPWEKFCVTAVNTINKAFTSVSRGCGERCSELCESIGYGQDQVNCDDCCEEDQCNSNYSVQYYEVLMSRQYTSWTSPLSGELEFSHKRGIRFPYPSSSSSSLSTSSFKTQLLFLLSLLILVIYDRNKMI